MKFGTVSPGRYTGADRYTGVAVGRRSTVWCFDISAAEFPQQKRRAEILLWIYQNTIHLNDIGK